MQTAVPVYLPLTSQVASTTADDNDLLGISLD